MGLGRRARRRRRQPAGRRDRARADDAAGRGGARAAGDRRRPRIAEESGERARKRRRPEVPAWARREIARFHAHVLFELLGLRELVMATPDDDVGRALRLCLSSILVKFMKAGPTAPRDGEAKRIARGVPSRMLADRAAELARGLAALERRDAGRHAGARRCTEGDARALPMPAASGGAGAVVAALRRHLRLRRASRRALPLARAVARRSSGACSSARGPSTSATSRARPGASEQARFMAEIARVLRPGGRALLVVGDGVVDGRAENAPDGIAAAGAPVGLEPVARASQARPMHDRRLAEIFAGGPAPRAPAAAGKAQLEHLRR